MNGEELIELRLRYQVTQAELAEHLGYFSAGIPNRSVISRWENGVTTINPRLTMLIRRYFNDIEEQS